MEVDINYIDAVQLLVLSYVTYVIVCVLFVQAVFMHLRVG